MREAGIKLFAASEQNLHVASDETLSGRKTYTTGVTLINTPSVSKLQDIPRILEDRSNLKFD